MQSDLQDAPAMVKKEHAASPRPLKWIIKKPVDFDKVDTEVGCDGSIDNSSNSVALGTRESIQSQSYLEYSPSSVKKEHSRSPRPSKKSRKRALHRAEPDAKDGGDESVGSTSNQLVLYNPDAINTTQDLLPVSDHSESYTSTLQNAMASNPASRILPSVGAFTVQCANCFKWRLIPTKEIYEEIREHILQRPFTCDRAREWRPDITCDDPADISQDGSRLWAIDKPNIAQPPPGWERQLRIRGEGSTKFADVYYVAPSGKKLRSMVEVQKYLLEHPGYIEQGVKLSQFSFQIPRPLQENYVRKRPAARMASPLDGGFGLPRPLEPDEVNPLSWVEPTDEEFRQIHPYSESPDYRPLPFESPMPPPTNPSPPEKKKANRPKICIKNYSSSSSSSTVHPAKEL